MSLIDVSLEKSVEEKGKDAVRILNARLDESFQMLINNAKSIFNTVWRNEDHELTPEVIFAALGTSAVKLIQISLATQAFVNSLQPETLVLPALKKITPNEDGSVVLSELEE